MSALIVYFFLACLLLPASFIASHKKASLTDNVFLWLAIFVAALIIGLRWDPLNEDFLNYYNLVAGKVPDYALERVELIPKYLVIFLQYFKLPAFLWFVFMALVQLIFIVLTASKNIKQILPWMFLLYFYSLFSLSLIITRQLVALTIVLYAYTFIEKRKMIPYLFYIFFAYCFHRTALVCLPLYWLIPFIRLNSVKLQFVIVILFLVFGDSLIATFWEYAPIDQEVFRYASYADREFDYGAKSGLGVLSNYIRYSIIILYSPKLKEKFKSTDISIFYTLLFIQICLYKSMMNDLAFSRIIMYFSIADLVVTGYLLHYLLCSKNEFNRFVHVAIVSVLLITIIYQAYKSPAWAFV